MDRYIIIFAAGVFLLIIMRVAVSMIDFFQQGSKYFRKMNKKLDAEKIQKDEF